MQQIDHNKDSSKLSSKENKQNEKRIALFPGTFDPFTIGHESLVKRGLTVMDEIVIAIGVNDSKKSFFSVEKRIQIISELYADNPQVSVESYNTLTVDFANKIGAKYILRGIRSVIDFEYEKSIADMNRTISEIETFVLFTEPSLSHISSSIVRELMQFGHDVSELIPKGLKID